MLGCYYPSQLLRSCFISLFKRLREGQSLRCCRISFHFMASLNLKLSFVISNRVLGSYKFFLFANQQLELWDLFVNSFFKFSGYLPYRILVIMTNLSYFINFLKGNQSQTHPFLCFPFSINIMALDCNFCKVSSLELRCNPI